jgi:hypothetical protein
MVNASTLFLQFETKFNQNCGNTPTQTGSAELLSNNSRRPRRKRHAAEKSEPNRDGSTLIVLNLEAWTQLLERIKFLNEIFQSGENPVHGIHFCISRLPQESRLNLPVLREQIGKLHDSHTETKVAFDEVFQALDNERTQSLTPETFLELLLRAATHHNKWSCIQVCAVGRCNHLTEEGDLAAIAVIDTLRLLFSEGFLQKNQNQSGNEKHESLFELPSGSEWALDLVARHCIRAFKVCSISY